MTWVRGGDTAAMHPITLAVLEHESCDDRLVNELFGFAMRCAMQSGAHMTDYVVSHGTAAEVAGLSRVGVLVELAQWAGYITDVIDVGDGRRAYKLVDDPEFIHLRLRAEVEWERERARNNRDPALVVPVRFRDGDACRYCLRVVNWADRKGRLGATYDHLQPGVAATADTAVVACRSCNSRRGDNPDALILQPEPTEPYYSPSTVKWFAEHEWAKRNRYVLPDRVTKTAKEVRPGDYPPGVKAPAASETPSDATEDQRPGSRPGNAPSDPAAGRGTLPATRQPAGERTARTSPRAGDAAPVAPQPHTRPTTGGAPSPAVTSADHESADICQIRPDPADYQGSRRVGSGRDGPGLVGSGADLDSVGRQSPPRRRGRGRRRSRASPG